MRKTALSSCLFVSLLVVGCSSTRPDSVDGPLAEAEGRIGYGTVDAAHTAVVALLGDAGNGGFTECSGTIVQVKNGDAYILTAAHCCNSIAPSVVVLSNDYNVGEQYVMGGNPAPPAFSVAAGSVYYDALFDQFSHDFCMLKVLGVPANTPVIPVAQPGQDGLALGTQVEHVGFGVSDNNQNNSGRRSGVDVVDKALTSLILQYSQGGAAHIPGPCEGDSGGPALVPAGVAQDQQMVVATTSYGNSQSCAQTTIGVSTRVTSETGPNGFITSFLADTPSGTQAGSASSSTSAAASSSSTSAAASSGTGGASSSSGAGGSSAIATTGSNAASSGNGASASTSAGTGTSGSAGGASPNSASPGPAESGGCSLIRSSSGSAPLSGASIAGLLLVAAIALQRRRRAA